MAPAKEHGGLIVATPTPNAPARDAPPKARKHAKDEGKTCAGELGVWLGSLGSPEKASQFGPGFVLQMGCESTQPRFRAGKSARLFAPRQVLRVTSYNRCGHNLLSFCSTPPLQIREGSVASLIKLQTARQDQLHAVLQPSIRDCSCRRIQRCAI